MMQVASHQETGAAITKVSVCLTEAPNPMGFPNAVLNCQACEKPTIILPVGRTAEHATLVTSAKIKNALQEIPLLCRGANEEGRT